MTVKLFAVDYDFIETMGMEVLAGRSFSREFATDAAQAFIVNDTAAKTFGWENAIGREGELSWVKKQGKVIGVIKDFHFRSLRETIQPAVFTIAPPGRFLWEIVVQVQPQNLHETIAYLQDAWQQVAPQWPFDYSFLDQQLDAQYRTEARLGKLMGYLTGISILVACLGLFGLASFTAERRTKEIGIRKALGASVANIVHLLTQEFVRLVLIANLVAWPLAYLATTRWLQSFSYQVPVGVDIFVLAACAALAVALLTVSFHAVRASTSNPVDSLRYE